MSNLKYFQWLHHRFDSVGHREKHSKVERGMMADYCIRSDGRLRAMTEL